MEPLYHAIRESTAGLYLVLYRSPLFFIDLWSIVHLLSGAALALALGRLHPVRRWWLLTGALLAYEVLELAFIYGAVRLFRPETLPDQVTDVLVGLAGGMLAELGRGLVRDGRLRRLFPTGAGEALGELCASLLIAAVWVGSYGYRYNRPFLNSDPVNWWALLLWTTGLFVSLRVHASFRVRGMPEPLAACAVWPLYWSGLLGLEFLGCRVLDIRELGGHPPLVFGLVHGTPALWAFYLAAGPLVLTLAGLLRERGRRLSG